MVIALLAEEGATEATLEYLRSSYRDLGGCFSFGHWSSSCERKEEGEEGNLGELHDVCCWMSLG